MNVRFCKFAVICAITTLTLGSGFVSAAPITYNVNSGPLGIDGGTVTGTLETDGMIGVLSGTDILTWSLLLTDGIGDSFTLTPGNSVLTLTGTATTATANLLQFNFDTPNNGDLGYFQILDSAASWGWQLATPGNTPVEGLVVANPSAQGFDAGLLSLDPQPITIGSAAPTPEPSTFVLLTAGLGIVGARRYVRRRPRIGAVS